MDLQHPQPTTPGRSCSGAGGQHTACVCAVRTSMPGQGMVLLVMKPFRPGAAGTFQTMSGMYRDNCLDFAPLPRVHRGSLATIAWHTLCRSPILPFPAAESCTALGLSAMGWPAVCGSMRSYGAGSDHECLPKCMHDCFYSVVSVSFANHSHIMATNT